MSIGLNSLNHSVVNSLPDKSKEQVSKDKNKLNLREAVSIVSAKQKASLLEHLDPAKNRNKTPFMFRGAESLYSKLSGIEKYKYIQAQAQAKKLEYSNVINDPEAALSAASDVINSILGLGSGSNELQKAIQAKQIALSRLDINA